MEQKDEEFRDSLSTIDESGKRVWIFPKKPFGKFYNKRKLVSYLLLILLLTIPYMTINSEPVILFNIIERKFVFFGQIFWPQDLHIFALAMIVMVLFVTLFTVVFGRLFCGWICPQTIFMEMVFRRIEYWIEGDWNHQKKLKKAPWNREKIFKKSAKHFLFAIISFVIANTFLSYIIGYQALWAIILDDPLKHIGGLTAILIFTTLFYLVFTKMREQVCTVVCPYGRLQGVLLDDRSLNVTYDYKRGEGRAKFKKNEDRDASGKGDCIDCNQCVNVCPTGIDIRNGIQLECVNCTACIDACDHIMEGVGLDKGLIRYASNEGIKTGSKFEFTKRVKAYIILLLGLVSLLVLMLVTRSDFQATILRTRGTLFQELDNNVISNIYDFSIINKTNRSIPVNLRILEGRGEIKMIGDDILLDEQAEVNGKFMILIPRDSLNYRKETLKIGVFESKELIEEVETTFIAPVI